MPLGKNTIKKSYLLVFDRRTIKYVDEYIKQYLPSMNRSKFINRIVYQYIVAMRKKKEGSK